MPIKSLRSQFDVHRFRASLPVAIHQMIDRSTHSEATRKLAEEKFSPRADRLLHHVAKKKPTGRRAAEFGYLEQLVASVRAFITIHDSTPLSAGRVKIMTGDEFVLCDSLPTKPSERVGKDYLKPASLYVVHPEMGADSTLRIGAEILVSLLGKNHSRRLRGRLSRLQHYWEGQGRILYKQDGSQPLGIAREPINLCFQWFMTADERVRNFNLPEVQIKPIGLRRLEIERIAFDVLREIN